MNLASIIGGAAVIGMAGLPPVNAASAADLLSGEWRGSYTCYQGITALTLFIEPDGEQWLSDDLTTLSGEMDFDGCTTFETTRTTPLPALPPKTK